MTTVNTLEFYSYGVSRLINTAGIFRRGEELTDKPSDDPFPEARPFECRENTCRVCGYGWVSMSDACMSRCPSCRSRQWDSKELFKHECLQCGHIWKGRTSSPIRCPSCKTRAWGIAVDASSPKSPATAPGYASPILRNTVNTRWSGTGECHEVPTDDEVLAEYASKGSPAAVAMSLGVSVDRVMRILAENGARGGGVMGRNESCEGFWVDP